MNLARAAVCVRPSFVCGFPLIERRATKSMDTRKRNVLIGVCAAILVVVVILAVLMVSGGSSQDEAASKTDSAVAAASDASSNDVGAMRASGDGTADNEVDASEVYGDSPDAAMGTSAGGASASGADTPSARGSGSTPDNQPGGSNAGSDNSSEKGPGDSAGSDRQVALIPASKPRPMVPSGRVTTKPPILIAPTARQLNNRSGFQDDSWNPLF